VWLSSTNKGMQATAYSVRSWLAPFPPRLMPSVGFQERRQTRLARGPYVVPTNVCHRNQ
jgi:hypothetical protein